MHFSKSESAFIEKKNVITHVYQYVVHNYNLLLLINRTIFHVHSTYRHQTKTLVVVVVHFIPR